MFVLIDTFNRLLKGVNAVLGYLMGGLAHTHQSSITQNAKSVSWPNASNVPATGTEYETVKCPSNYNTLHPTKKSSETKLLVRNL